jgi:hypothetical protein
MPQKRYNKTPTMQLLESKDPEKRNVSQIMLDAYRDTGSEANAAKSMGITQQAFNDWKYRLGLKKQINEIAFGLKYGVSVADDEGKSTDNDTKGQDGRVADEV